MARNQKVGGAAGLGASKPAGMSGLGKLASRSRRPGSGLKLHNASGAGSVGPAAAPKVRIKNPSRHRMNPQGEQTEDTGNIRKSGAYKSLMSNLRGRGGSGKVSNTGRFGKPADESNDIDEV